MSGRVVAWLLLALVVAGLVLLSMFPGDPQPRPHVETVDVNGTTVACVVLDGTGIACDWTGFTR